MGVYHGLTRTAIILTVTPSSALVAAPLAGYGAVGSTQNMWTGSDSGAQGMAWAYSKEWVFHAIQIGSVAPSGYEISLYGSNDPRLLVPPYVSQRPTPYIMTPTGRDGALRLPIGTDIQNGDVTAVPANSWVQVPAPSDQGTIVIDYNPITAVGQMLYAKRPLIAVRAVLTATPAAVGSLAICLTAV